MKKRVLSLALAAAMAASLTACSGNSTTTETTAAVEETKAAENANTESKEADGSGVDVSDWKNKTVTCIVPYDAGGGTDTVMRALADRRKGLLRRIFPLKTVPAAAERQVCSRVPMPRQTELPLP